MASHASTLAWKIPWVEEPGRLQSMGSLRVGHDWATSLSLSCIGEGNGNPLQYFYLENPRDGGAWWAAVYRVTQSRTWLKRLNSNSITANFRVMLFKKERKKGKVHLFIFLMQKSWRYTDKNTVAYFIKNSKQEKPLLLIFYFVILVSKAA